MFQSVFPRRLSQSILLLVFLFSTLGVSAQIRLPRLISDGVVLQRDQDLELWGWASPDERIRIEVAGQKLRTRADGEGKWSVQLPAQPAGGPFELQLSGKNEVTVSNVMFGDVWVCSGQSNMTIPMERVKEVYPEDIATANEPAIREFFVATMTDLSGPREDFPEGEWKVVTPENVMSMSAIGYFFARRLHDTYDVPIGIINTAVGGTPIEAWTSAEGLSAFPDLTETIARNQDTAYIRSLSGGGGARPSCPPPVTDRGLQEKWYAADYRPQGWQDINIPGYWEDQGVADLNGTVWYRREVTVPAAWAGKELKLFMGRIVDADFVYVNGEQVGNITYQYPPRRYTVPAGLLKAGKNLIAVRVLNYGGKGGFVPEKPYYLTDGADSLDLKGTWQYKVGEVFPPRSRNGGGGGGFPFVAQNQPTALYNAMVAPLERFGVKGFTWYQGESNVTRAQQYYAYLPALLRDWRAQFGQGDLPFLTVQLANFQDATYLPVESQWAVLRDAQLQSLALPNTGLAVTTDIGEWNDIHPLDKLDVAERLALNARHLAYGEDDLIFSGPIYRSDTVMGKEIRVRFAQVGAGLKTSDGLSPAYFAIAGYDRNYVWADARIDGDEVVVSSEEVPQPRYVRYAWADNPFGANLTNDRGLPASPFQTDYRAGEENDLWHGHKAAVVLTYDDAMAGQLDRVIPTLDSLNLKGSFYLTAAFPGFRDRVEDWRSAARRGHELGNHTVYHPCDASKPGRDWVAENNDLSKYTTAEILQEIDVTNSLLQALDGQTERTFAYTCGDTATGDGSFKDSLAVRFTAARGTEPGLDTPATADLYDLHTYVASNNTAEEMIAWVEEAKRQHALVTILFHGVGGGHNINVSNEAHRKLIEYLYRDQDEVWVTTLREMAEHLRAQRAVTKR